MFALARLSVASKDKKYLNWAIELAENTHDKFVYGRNTPEPHMYWKMSIDLTRPLVQSEGNLDPFDGFVTYRFTEILRILMFYLNHN